MFLLFTLLVSFILLNVFIAIVSDAFASVREEQEVLDDVEDMGFVTLGTEIWNYLLYHALFRVPIVGRYLQRAYTHTKGAVTDLHRKHAQAMVRLGILGALDKDADGKVGARARLRGRTGSRR